MWSLCLRLPHQNPVYDSPLPHTRYIPAFLILLELITRKILGEEYRSLSSLLCSFLHSPVTSSLLIFKFFYSNLKDSFCYERVLIGP